MGDSLLLVGLGAMVFAATDVDDLFLLVGFFSDARFRAGQVVLGQYLGIGTLMAISVALSLTALVIPGAYVGLLGLVPLGMGVWKLLGRESESEDGSPPRGANVLAVAAVTIANGGDNLGVYAPLFATRRPAEVAVLAVVILVMTGVWCALALSLVRHRTLGEPIRKYARLLLPWVLIALGAYILIDAWWRAT